MMTLETAPLIELGGFVPDVPGAEAMAAAAGDGALEAAVRQLGGSESLSATPRDEILLDLWVDARSGYRAEGAQRDGLERLGPIDWLSLTAQPDDGTSALAGKDAPRSASLVEPTTIGGGWGLDASMRYEAVMPSGYYPGVDACVIGTGGFIWPSWGEFIECIFGSGEEEIVVNGYVPDGADLGNGHTLVTFNDGVRSIYINGEWFANVVLTSITITNGSSNWSFAVSQGGGSISYTSGDSSAYTFTVVPGR